MRLEEERRELLKEIFTMFDTDGDGKLNEEEYKAYVQARGDPRE